MDAERIKREAADARDAREAAAASPVAVVSPPPLDALWHADFEASAAFDEPLGRFTFTDADALAQALATSSDSSDALPPAPAADSDPAPREDKHAKQAAIAARRRRAYRVKKKSELETLREARNVLGDRLAGLIARNEALKNRLVEHGRADRFAAGWRGVALRQLQRRLQAEALNRELRVLVRQHRDVAQTLVCTLQSQVTAVAPKQRDVLKLSRPQRPKEAVHLLESDVRTAAEFLREVDATYVQAHAVLRSCQPPPTTDEAYNSRQSWRLDSQTKSEFFELIETWAIPFDLEDAVPAMHRSLPIILAKECHPAVIPVSDPTNTTAIKFVFSCSDSEQRPTRYQCILVAKVFVEKDHAVFRWRAVTVEIESPSDKIIEMGWGVAQRAPSASGRQDQPAGTDIKFYTRFEMCEDVLKSQDGQQRSKQLEKYVRSMFSDVQEDVSEWYQVIESLVMKDLSSLSIT